MTSGYAAFTERNVEIVAVGPNTAEEFRKYWTSEQIPFIGLPDPTHQVARLYRQEVNLFKLGRMPLNCIVDREGRIRFIHYGATMRDIPDNKTILQVIDQLGNSPS